MMIFFLLISFSLQAATNIDGMIFNTRSEYLMMGKPCACPDDLAANGRCGKRAALCKDRGKHILDCDGKKVTSIQDYRKVRDRLCGY